MVPVPAGVSALQGWSTPASPARRKNNLSECKQHRENRNKQQYMGGYTSAHSCKRCKWNRIFRCTMPSCTAANAANADLRRRQPPSRTADRYSGNCVAMWGSTTIPHWLPAAAAAAPVPALAPPYANRRARVAGGVKTEQHAIPHSNAVMEVSPLVHTREWRSTHSSSSSWQAMGSNSPTAQ